MDGTSEPTLTTAELSQRVGGRLVGPGDLRVGGMQVLDRAVEGELSYVGSARHVKHWAGCAAKAALVSEDLELEPGDGRALIFVADVDLATAEVLKAFAPPPPACAPGVHPSAVVDDSARIDPTAAIGPQCVIGPRVTLGAGAVLHGSVHVMEDSSIGRGTVIFPGTVVRERCTIGDVCILHPNVTIGADGFGYRPAPDGRSLVKIPQIGTVEIGHAVEIGSSTCIDRGKFGPTVIGDGTKIDNLCQIGHNCEIGRCVVIAGTTAISGSVRIGDGAVLAGRSGAVDHVRIGAGATLAATSVATKDVPPGTVVAGNPAREATMYKREIAALRKLPELIRKIKRG